jgi:hypothetical protein
MNGGLWRFWFILIEAVTDGQSASPGENGPPAFSPAHDQPKQVTRF